MFHHFSKHLEVRQNSLLRELFLTLFLVFFGSVVKYGLLYVFDVLQKYIYVVLMQFFCRHRENSAVNHGLTVPFDLHILPVKSLSVERISSSAKQKRSFCYNPAIK